MKLIIALYNNEVECLSSAFIGQYTEIITPGVEISCCFLFFAVIFWEGFFHLDRQLFEEGIRDHSRNGHIYLGEFEILKKIIIDRVVKKQ